MPRAPWRRKCVLDHRRRDITAGEFLRGADIMTGLEKVRGK